MLCDVRGFNRKLCMRLMRPSRLDTKRLRGGARHASKTSNKELQRQAQRSGALGDLVANLSRAGGLRLKGGLVVGSLFVNLF